ncbi:thiopurine S-methyltransferase [Pseudoroseicyclus tamaricis]|uniref:Thiopurine S-methyltransferase n=1 Tax=Pseudoroseicyclus tamaricis TaxID=2705421 RepID=A0A6B2JZ50_9RHOB|nr:thiopurine S-methyltransferase [Pseudoroseicyclus tamaricis]NDV00652.1 thiopurine S-methyltransferase [Pseudoroseicyclus tamaricis]
MEQDFWQSRWRENKIGFHEGRPNALLEEHVGSLGLAAGDRVVVPLCGKAVDLDWLCDRGVLVTGIELNESAAGAVFDRLGLTPEVEAAGPLTRYAADRLTIFVGDVFAVTREMLGPVAAVYDRAALVALPPPMRQRYAPHLAEVTGRARQLLITFDYDQETMDGPPFAVPPGEVERLYGEAYRPEILSRRAIEGSLAQRCSGEEIATLLVPR